MPLQRDDNGKLPGIAFPGGYSIRYLCRDSEVVCADCANEWKDGEWEGQEPTEGFIDWEGPTSFCAHCNSEMPTEYGDPDES